MSDQGPCNCPQALALLEEQKRWEARIKLLEDRLRTVVEVAEGAANVEDEADG